MLGIIKMEKKKVKAAFIGKMVLDMKGNFIRIRFMGKEFTLGQMEESI